jgi:hypothetical protein
VDVHAFTVTKGCDEVSNLAHPSATLMS